MSGAFEREMFANENCHIEYVAVGESSQSFLSYISIWCNKTERENVIDALFIASGSASLNSFKYIDHNLWLHNNNR